MPQNEPSILERSIKQSRCQSVSTPSVRAFLTGFLEEKTEFTNILGVAKAFQAARSVSRSRNALVLKWEKGITEARLCSPHLASGSANESSSGVISAGTLGR